MEERSYQKSDLMCGLVCYVIWGVLPLYWDRLSHIDAITLLCFRIVFAAIFSLILLAVTKRFSELAAVLKNKSIMRFLVPAAILVTANWGVYIYAMVSGHVMEASLGYYIEPLVLIAFGFLLFRERCGIFEWIALGFAIVGAAYSAIRFGSLPFIAIALALTFSIYGALKRYAGVGGLTSIAAETLIMFPVALGYLLLSPTVRAAAPAWTWQTWVLLAAAGPATAAPLMLYTRGVNGLPFITMGFLQFICPTLIMLSGLLLGETLTKENLVVFAFIWIGLVFFVYGLYRRNRVAPLKNRG